ncbi:MAG: FGGY-family carbohydrate kinase [Armatimonadota bacterium]
MSLLGLDMGTSSCKAAVFDESGKMLAHASRKYTGYAPRPGWYEIDPAAFWNAAVEAVREVSSIVSEPVQAMSVSSQGETFIPVDSTGIPVGPAIMNSDNRAVAEVEYLDNHIGKERIFSITGDILHPMYSLPKIMWYISHSETAGKTAKYLSVGDYILTCMGLPTVTDYSLASRTLAFDVTAHRWSEEILDAAGVSTNMLPEIAPSGIKAGQIQGQIAQVLGVPAGTVVAVGGHDQPVGALGAGVLDVSTAMDSAGSYECLAVISNKPLLTEEAFSYSLN